MDEGPLTRQIIEVFGTLSGQLQLAARYILDHPRDVALLSMRDQARYAGVQPATMTRFAKHLGLDGYDQIREAYAAAVRGGEIGFTGKADSVSPKHKGDRALAAEMITSLAGQIASLNETDALDRLVVAAERLAKARRVYCLSLRSMHPISWHFHYIMTLIGERSVLLDAVGATGGDAFGRATKDDVLLAATVFPYTRATVEMAEHAASRGIPVVAITDSVVSPLAQVSNHVILAPTESPGFFHAMSPAFVVAEILATLVAGRGGNRTIESLRHVDEYLAAFQIHMQRPGAKRAT